MLLLRASDWQQRQGAVTHMAHQGTSRGIICLESPSGTPAGCCVSFWHPTTFYCCRQYSTHQDCQAQHCSEHQLPQRHTEQKLQHDSSPLSLLVVAAVAGLHFKLAPSDDGLVARGPGGRLARASRYTADDMVYASSLMYINVSSDGLKRIVKGCGEIAEEGV